MAEIQIIQLNSDEFEKRLVSKTAETILKAFKDFEPKNEERLLTRKEATEKLRIDQSSLHRWTKSGILQSYRISNRVFYKESEILAALQPIKAQ